MWIEKLETIIFKYIYSVFIGAGVRHLFLIPHSYIHEAPTKIPPENILNPQKYPREKNWTQEIPTTKNLVPTRKNFEPTKYSPQKITDSRSHDGTMARGPQDPQWHETHRSSHTQ